MHNEKGIPAHEASDPLVPDQEVTELIDMETDRLLSGVAEDIDEYPLTEVDENTGNANEVTYRNGSVHASFLSPEGERVTIARSTSEQGTITTIKLHRLAEKGIHGPYTVYNTSELEKYAGGAKDITTVAFYYGGELHKDGRRIAPPLTPENDTELQSALEELRGLRQGGGNTGIHRADFEDMKHSLSAISPEYRQVYYGTEIDFDGLTDFS